MIRVQLADDHPAMREGLRYVLSRLDGVTVVEPDICNGLNFSGFVRRGRADILMCDVKMPHFNIIPVLKDLQKTSCETRVLVYCSEMNYRLLRGLIAVGVSGCILKEEAITANLQDILRLIMQGDMCLSPKICVYLRPIVNLSRREQQILDLMVEKYRVAEMAECLHIAPSTIYNTLACLRSKLGVNNNIAALSQAVTLGLVQVDAGGLDELGHTQS